MKLEKKIHAVNEVQRLSVLNFNHILPILKEFVGQKILLASGDKSAKFKKALSFLDEQPKKFGEDYARLHRCMLDVGRYSIWLKISCSFKDNDTSCFYEEQEIYMGKMENGILTEIETGIPEFETYKIQDVKALMSLKKEYKDKLDAVKSKLRKFDGYYS